MTNPAQQLKDLTARQTELFNRDAPLEERVKAFKEIQEIQKQRRNQN